MEVGDFGEHGRVSEDEEYDGEEDGGDGCYEDAC